MVVNKKLTIEQNKSHKMSSNISFNPNSSKKE